MVVHESITPIKTDCAVGDLVQYDGMTCLVIRVGNVDNPVYEYGLVSFSEDYFKENSIVVTNMSLWDIQKSIQGVLVKACDLEIRRKDGFDIETMTGIPSASSSPKVSTVSGGVKQWV